VLIRRLVEDLESVEDFEVDDISGESLTKAEASQIHCERIQALQSIAFRSFPKQLRGLALANIGAVEKRGGILEQSLGKLNDVELRALAVQLALMPPTPRGDGEEETRELITEVVVRRFEKRPSRVERLSKQPLFPTEENLWDETSVIVEHGVVADKLYALPKLNL
jgi:hypothetical protein